MFGLVLVVVFSWVMNDLMRYLCIVLGLDDHMIWGSLGTTFNYLLLDILIRSFVHIVAVGLKFENSSLTLEYIYLF